MRSAAAITSGHFWKQRNRAGLLAGVPTFVKDNIDLCGLPTRHGSEAVPDTSAARDESFAKQYCSLGLSVLGKTAMPEFGLNCTTEYQCRPATRNPWHTDHSSGGSSGGSAALVAAGVVPIAHANDGAGSIRIPAAWCGLVGLKPSRGRLVPAQVARSLPVKIVVEGVLTRTVRDTAHFFAGSEQYWRNAKLPAIGLVEGPGRRPLTIGITTDSAIGVPISPEICRVVEQTADMLASLGHRVEHAHFNVPRTFAKDFTDYWTFIAFSIRRFGRLHFGQQFDADKLENLTRELARHFQRRCWRLPLALLRLQKMAWQHTVAHPKHDLLLSPVTSRIAPELGFLNPDQPFDELFQRMLSFAAFTPLNNANVPRLLRCPWARRTTDCLSVSSCRPSTARSVCCWSLPTSWRRPVPGGESRTASSCKSAGPTASYGQQARGSGSSHNSALARMLSLWTTS